MVSQLIPGLAFCIGTNLAFGQAVSDIQARPGASAYLQDSRGVIARSGFGLCWRTGTWTPADAVPGCDGELVPPVTKAIAPDVAPASPPAPPQPAPKRCDFSITLGADDAFEFNKASLSPAARKRLDQDVLERLNGCARVDAVQVAGHADRLGSQQYNQRLSEKRAEAVAGYLKSRGVSAEIETFGFGKTQPVKACGDGIRQPELISCLAANRRVVIEVRGTGK